jgi:hypothetical protein
MEEIIMRLRLLLTIAAIGLASTAARAEEETNFCKMTAQAALRSCQISARSDYWLGLGRCDNVADSAQRKVCIQQAAVDLKDARDQCTAQDSVRAGACLKLGPEPFDPAIDPEDFVDHIDNPYFPLEPGTDFVYEGKTSAGLVHNDFIVTHKTKKILGVTTTEIHDIVSTNGKVTEDTLDWFAQDKDGNVWYFGENTEELIGGRPSTLSGTFTAGTNNDRPGIIMEAHPKIGDFYRQEFSLNNAEDYGSVASLTDTVKVRAGRFTHCLRSPESTPLEPSLHEVKWYAPGIGNVLTKDLETGERMELIRIEKK